jgi:hypothetical protein
MTCKTEKHRIHKEHPKITKLKMLQAQFEKACSWTVLERVSYQKCRLNIIVLIKIYDTGTFTQTSIIITNALKRPITDLFTLNS